jgi:archaemetzincin
VRERIGLVLLGSSEEGVLRKVTAAVSEGLGVGVDLLGRTELREGFDGGRGQYRADVVIEGYLARFASPGRSCVGLTGVDLYMPSLNFVFGLALKNRGLAVVSWYRLRNGDDLMVLRLAKEVIHEVGHLEGLEHCPNRSCVMWFSNTLSETDSKETSFCTVCVRKRRSAGEAR